MPSPDEACVDSGPTGWASKSLFLSADKLIGLVVWITVLLLAVYHLPPGVCTGDNGELQLAAVTLGIAHPPGYVCLVSMVHPLTRLPGLDPAYAVSLGCLGAGLVALSLCMLFQARLGVPPVLAGAVALLWVGHDRVWVNLSAPEVYMPSLALLGGGVYLFARYLHLCGLRAFSAWYLIAAAILLGSALAVRPPVVIVFPFLMFAWYRHLQMLGSKRSVSKRHLVWFTVGVLLPLVYTFIYVWFRDTPDALYNYLDEYNRDHAILPAVRAGIVAKSYRFWWLYSGAQFHEQMGLDGAGIPSRVVWLLKQATAGGSWFYVPAMVLAFIGGYLVYRRFLSEACLLIGVIASSAFFVLFYRVDGLEADLLPLVWAGAILAGVALSRLTERNSFWRRWRLNYFLLAGCVAWSFLDAPQRPPAGLGADAERFLAGVEFDRLPRGSVIFASWNEMTPLWYALRVRLHRSDVTVIHGMSAERIKKALAEKSDGVFVAPDRVEEFAQFKLAAEGSLYRVVGEDGM